MTICTVQKPHADAITISVAAGYDLGSHAIVPPRTTKGMNQNAVANSQWHALKQRDAISVS
jgi:hypothetical protein